GAQAAGQGVVADAAFDDVVAVTAVERVGLSDAAVHDRAADACGIKAEPAGVGTTGVDRARIRQAGREAGHTLRGPHPRQARAVVGVLVPERDVEIVRPEDL